MRKLISDEGLYNVANTLDQLMNMDVPARGTIGVLYEAARKLQNGDPMTLAAIRLLQKTVKRGDYVFIATLFTDGIIEHLLKPQERRVKNYYVYRDSLHGTNIPRTTSLRAPPYSVFA